MQIRPILLLLLAMAILANGLPIFSEETTGSIEAWEAEAVESGLSETAISTLKMNRILITNENYKQIFSAYISARNPLFITSDSLLNAYHVLYEESIFRLESTRAAHLPEILKVILSKLKDADGNLKGKPKLVSAAKKRAMLVLGIALRLMDDSFKFENQKLKDIGALTPGNALWLMHEDYGLNEILTQEVQNITEAQGIQKPKWLINQDQSFTLVDYSRYKPRGFYTRTHQLQKYFRAVSWLQSIPFRVAKDEEYLAILLLGNAASFHQTEYFRRDKKEEEYKMFFRSYSMLVGDGDDWDLMKATNSNSRGLEMDLGSDDLRRYQNTMNELAKDPENKPQINDQLRFAPDDPKEVAEPNFRILSAYRTPTALLFQRTTDTRLFKSRYPNGLEVATALGSTFARSKLDDPQKELLLDTIDSCQSCLRGKSLYLIYLDALRTLLDDPEPADPDFMKTDAWRTKSCNTVLAGWAQLSHTWALQAKQTVEFLCGVGGPEGFVEPEPEFYGRMAELAEVSKLLLRQSGAFAPLDPGHNQLVADLEKLAQMLKGVETHEQLDEKYSKLSHEDRIALRLPFMILERGVLNDLSNEKLKSINEKERYENDRAWIAKIIADIKAGNLDKHPEVVALLEESNFDLESLWDRLEKVSLRLEIIAHKQFRGVDLNESDNAFVKSYGVTIAGIMLYKYNSCIRPDDDAPRIVDVFSSPQKGEYFHVGVARPWKMYVLYPWHGKIVLCSGAIMPYYEFVDTSRLTDTDWIKRLDSEGRPSIPQWMSPIVNSEKPIKPKMEEKD